MISSGKRSPKKHGLSRHVQVDNNNIPGDVKTDTTPNIYEWDKHLALICFSRKKSIGIIVVLSLVCYSNSVFGGFVFDDVEAISNNKDVYSDTSLTKIFSHDFWGQNITHRESHKSYRPLTVLSFRWNFILAGGLHPISFHLVNIFLQVIISVLSLHVFEVLLGHNPSDVNQNELKSCPRAVWMCALLFTVHPIHTENVAGLVGRADLLCALFFCLSFLCYVHSCTHKESLGHSSVSLTLSVVFCAVAMLCKEQGITVLGICSVYDLVYTGNLSLSWLLQTLVLSPTLKFAVHDVSSWFSRHLKHVIIRHFVLVLSGLALLVWRYSVMGSEAPEFQQVDNPPSFMDNIILRIINYNYIYALNMWLLLCPHWLCFDWSMGCVPLIQSVFDVRILVIIVFWASLITLLIKCAIRDSHQDRVLLLALACLIVPFLPSSNIFFQVGFVIAERNLYLSSFGFCILVVLGVNLLCSLLSSRGQKVVTSLLVMIMLCHILKCIHRNQEWKEEKILYEAGLRVCPLNAKIHYNIGKSSTDAGQIDEAVLAYREAIRLYPQYDQALNNLANILKDSHEQKEAEQLLKKAVSIRPSFAAAWMNLGIVQANLEKYKESEMSYNTALKYRPHYPDCYYNLGNLYLAQKKFEKAAQFWDLTIQQKLDHSSAWINLVTLYQETGKYESGVSVAQEALKHLPHEASLYFGLGNILGKQGKYEEAEKSFLKAIQIDETIYNHFANLGVLYHRWQHYSDAETAYNAALKLNPDDKGTKENLQKLRRARDKRETSHQNV